MYFARILLIPLALAILLAFLLGPLAMRLRRWGLGRRTSALTVVLVSFALLGVIGVVVSSQLTDLAHKLPEYQQNIHRKFESLRHSGGGLITRFSRLTQSINAELTPSSPKSTTAEERPVPVEVRRAVFSPMELVRAVLGSAFSVLLTAVVVVVIVIFMLIQREDLRDRLLRLAGESRVNVTTQVLEDAAHRVSRYLLAQLVVNVAYGVVIGIGLYFVGLPNPMLWAVLAALLRYIPYLGIWVAACMPALIAVAVEPGWIKLALVFGIYGGTDVLLYNFVEPWFYGTSTGVSALGVLVAAVFWTWLWGPVGLLLATPLTVCLVVVGRYVPNLEFLSVMLSDEEVLTPETRFYQRLLAMDLGEATEIAEEFLKGRSLDQLYDKVVIPALSLAEEDRHRGKLDEERQKFIFENARVVIHDIASRAQELMNGEKSSGRTAARPQDPQPEKSLEGPATVVCIPARDEADELAAVMLSQLAAQRGIAAKALSSEELAGEYLVQVGKEGARIACVQAVPPFGYMHARYLCRRLRAQFPELQVIAAILTERDPEETRKRKPSIDANEVATSLQTALSEILSLASPNTCPANPPAVTAG
nr:hypothetical protein Hi04_10k_c5218_00028 [uncultured bacterium]